MTPFHEKRCDHRRSGGHARRRLGCRRTRAAQRQGSATASGSMSTLTRSLKRVRRVATAVPEAGVDVHEQLLVTGPRHAHQGVELALRREDQRVGRLPHPERGHVLGQLALEVLHRVGARHAQHVAPEVHRSASGAELLVVIAKPGSTSIPRRRRGRSPSCSAAAAAGAPRRRHRRQQGGRLVVALHVLFDRVAVGHDPGPGLHRGTAVGGHHHRADGDGGVEVAREVDVPDHAAVDAALGRLEVVDDLHGPHLGGPRQRPGRDRGPQDVDGPLARRQLPRHL